MVASHIHDALGQVRRLQELILKKRKFTGYSGTARMLGGSTAMLGCVLMGMYATSFVGHLIGWSIILFIALAANYGALLLWFIQLPNRERSVHTISPAFDAVPPLAIGAALSAALLLKGNPDLLFGTWMCCYGLAHTSCRTALPKENWCLGLGYIICGVFFLLWTNTNFTNPWPVGGIFLIGEWIGGCIFHRHKVEAMEEYDEE